MRQRDRQRHQLRRLGAGEAEHHALVAGALRVGDARRRHPRRAARARRRRPGRCPATASRSRRSRRRRRRRSPSSTSRSRSRGSCRATIVGMSAYASVVTSPATCTWPVVIRVSTATRLRGSCGEQRVEDRVADLVGDLVRVALRDRLGGEQAAGQRHSSGYRALRLTGCCAAVYRRVPTTGRAAPARVRGRRGEDRSGRPDARSPGSARRHRRGRARDRRARGARGRDPRGRSLPGAPGAGDPYFPLQGNGGYDVRTYRLDLRLRPGQPTVLDGTAAILATATTALSRFDLDLRGFTVSRSR